MQREPIVQGRFYPGNPAELKKNLEDCWSHPLGIGQRSLAVGGPLAGMIVPHAGYVFSGPVASWAFQRLAMETPPPEVIVLLGPKHTPFGARAAISAAAGWKTPLGSVPVHDEFRQKLAAKKMFQIDDQAHAGEHSLEVQIPFLQKVLPVDAYRILPIALQYAPYAVCREWGEALGEFLREESATRITCVVSSDFSHDTPREEAYRLDRQVLDVIESRSAEAFYRLVVSEDRSICGVIPITVFLVAMESARVRARVLTYATSMDIMDHPRGVGYAAVTFERTTESAG